VFKKRGILGGLITTKENQFFLLSVVPGGAWGEYKKRDIKFLYREYSMTSKEGDKRKS